MRLCPVLGVEQVGLWNAGGEEEFEPGVGFRPYENAGPQLVRQGFLFRLDY